MAKTPRHSLTEMTELVLPQHGNVVGTAFGGTVLAWMDICGAICAQRHTGTVCVTAALDNVNFMSPMRVGDVVVLSARVNAAFRSSLEVQVEVQVEDRATGARRLCVDSFMTFVSMTSDAKPSPVPELILESADDRRRHEEAQARRQERLTKK